MTYEAPTITEAGRFADITLGRSLNSNKHDNNFDWDNQTPGSR